MIKKIAIIGSGYVGLPLAIALSKFFSVISFDKSINRISQLKRGEDVNNQHDKKSILKKNLKFTYSEEDLKDIKTFIISVPTPINSKFQPDLGMLVNASNLVARFVKKKTLVIYESTTYPGCTEEICIPILEKISKLKIGEFLVGYSPERVNPGDKKNTLESITKIVSGNNSNSLNKVKKIYGLICKKIFCASSIKVAESAKVIENTQRDLNIALVNELSIIFSKLDISTNEVLKAASTKWNFQYYKPGLVGGHCISVDPYYLAFKSKTKKYRPKILLTGRKFNENMSKYVAKKALTFIKKYCQNSNKKKVAILGFSFKENIPDFRNSKIVDIINIFKKNKIDLTIVDSLVSKSSVMQKHNLKISDFKDLKKNFYDLIILAVSHKQFLKNISYYDKFFKNKKQKIFFDLKNNYSENELKKNNNIYFQL